MPVLRRRLLEDRFFYGWEGPDYRLEASYLNDEQWPNQMAYMTAIEAISGRRLCEVVELSDEERCALEQEGSKASTAFGPPERFCALWLLRKLSC